jgi:hypothetical protein
LWLGGRLVPAGLVSFVAALLTAWLAWRACTSGRFAAAGAIGTIGAVLVWAPWLQVQLPMIDQLWLSRSIAAALRAHDAAGSDRERLSAAPLAAVGYHEPSLVFLTDTRLAVLEPPTAAALLVRHPGAVIVVSEDQDAAFMQAATAQKIPLRTLWSTTGIDYTKGRRLQVRAYGRAEPTPAESSAGNP